MLFSDLSTEGLTSLDLVVRDSGDLYESGGCVILGELVSLVDAILLV